MIKSGACNSRKGFDYNRLGTLRVPAERRRATQTRTPTPTTIVSLSWRNSSMACLATRFRSHMLLGAPLRALTRSNAALLTRAVVADRRCRQLLVMPALFCPPPLTSSNAAARLCTAANGVGESQGRATIRRLLSVMTEARDGCSDRFEPTMGDDGVLHLDLGPEKGQYSIQESPGGTLLLFSPLSGPKYYTYDEENGWWSDPSDGHLLDELLVREVHPHALCFRPWRWSSCLSLVDDSMLM